MDKALLISATGTGKTYASAFAMRELGFKRVLFLVHRNQIARQAKVSFERVFGSRIRTGLISGNATDYRADRILPKGSSFDELTQQDITLMMNHINFYKRKKLNNRSPYETFSFYYGEDVLKRLGCSPVAAENIILKPKLLKK